MRSDEVSRRIRWVVILGIAALVSVPALAGIKTKPTVAIIKAEWCAACQKLDPAMMELMEQYADRLNFVVFDVSNEEKVAEAKAEARKRGLSRFLEENMTKTSTVAVFVKGDKPSFQTVKNFDRDAYVRAFEDAIASAAR